jgi:DNA-binding protein YbaB
MKFTIEIEADNIFELKHHLAKTFLRSKLQILSITEEGQETIVLDSPESILRPDKTEMMKDIIEKRKSNARLKIEALNEQELNKLAKGFGLETKAEDGHNLNKSELIESLSPIIKL